MVYLVKGTALLLLAVVVACSATNDCHDTQAADDLDDYVPRPKAPQQNIKIAEPGRAIIPINVETQDYCGPYDPFDPKGVGAARRRELHLKGKAALQELKTYYPKGLEKFLKKEGIKLAIGEGKRFAFSHPKETAMLIDVALKAKKLYSAAKDKVEKEYPSNDGKGGKGGKGCDKKSKC